ncbi:MAG: hypothetical protein JEZ07_03445 [Phycisphaerae bacterium]|nr:hypothetical protein [Phycisphaerae bacterium]
MGWTHYWKRDINLPEEPFEMAVKDCKKVFDSLEIELAGSLGHGDCVYDSDELLFNGVAGVCCEDFMIKKTQMPKREGRDYVSSFCKTEHMPYDICVQIALIILKHHLGDTMSVYSDGKESDWDNSRKLCQENLGYGEDFKLDIAD